MWHSPEQSCSGVGRPCMGVELQNARQQECCFRIAGLSIVGLTLQPDILVRGQC